jgi:hypothetical protein
MGQSFKDLLVWHHAIELTTEVYKLTANFPAAEKFGLTNQMRRAAVSIASNTAEGYGRAPQANTFNSLATHAAHAPNSRHNSSSQESSALALRQTSNPQKPCAMMEVDCSAR